MPFEFRFGTPESTTSAKKPVKLSKKKQNSKKSKQNVRKRTVSEPFELTTKFGEAPYYILPTKTQPLGLRSLLYQVKRSPLQQHRWLTSYIRKVADEKKKASKSSSQFKPKVQITPSYMFSLPPISLVKSELERNRKVHAALRKVVHVWRVKHLKSVNTEDIVTCEVPEKPITIVDWAQKTSTVFEASTLMRDITTCLLHHDGFFEEPKAPRNPLTNLPLTQSQVISVWTQLMKSGVPASAAFAQFRQARYSLESFRLVYGTSLRLHAFRDTMKNLLAYDSKECLFNFIDLCAETFEKSYSLTKLNQHIRSEDPNHVLYFQKWRKVCMQHYEAELLYAGQEDTCKSIQVQAIRRAQFLLENKDYFAPHVVRNLFPPASQAGQEEEEDEDEEENENEDEEASPAAPGVPPVVLPTVLPSTIFQQTVDIFLPFAPSSSNTLTTDATAMNVLMNLLLDMGDSSIAEFLPH